MANSRAHSRTKKSAYHIVGLNILDDDHEDGFTLLNSEVLGDGKGNIGFTEKSIRGFPQYPEEPRLLYNPKPGSEAWDLELCRNYWLVSERARKFFDDIEPSAFLYHDCDIVRPDGSPGPTRWLCDVVQVIDAIDEQRSDVKAVQNFVKKKVYTVSPGGVLAVLREKIGTMKIFQLLYYEGYVICNEEFKSRCIDLKLSGFRFGNSAINLQVVD